MLPSNMFKVLSNIKDGLLIKTKEASVFNKNTKEMIPYFLLYSYSENSFCSHLQVFNTDGECVFSGTDGDEFYMTQKTIPAIDSEVIKDATFGIWADLHGFWNYKDSELVVPEHLELVGQTFFVNKNSHTIFVYGTEAYNYGECSSCGHSLHSDAKRVTCPNCNTMNGIT